MIVCYTCKYAFTCIQCVCTYAHNAKVLVLKAYILQASVVLERGDLFVLRIQEASSCLCQGRQEPAAG